jgi:hypothetical protein
MALRIFIAESVGPEDFYEGTLDGFAANEVLKVRGIRSWYRPALNQAMLVRAIDEATRRDATVFHLSCHGNEEGVVLADDTPLPWDELAELFQPFATESRLLVNSSCGGGHGGCANAFQKASNRFGYICGSTADIVDFQDSCIAWSILYNVIANAENTSPPTMRSAIEKINAVVAGDFVYRRWDSRLGKYRYYPS